MSGPVTLQVPPEKRQASVQTRHVFDVERVADEEVYRVRFGINGQPAPYTMWVLPRAALLRITQDSPVPPATADDVVPDAYDLMRVAGIPDGSLGEWRVGESRIIPVSLPINGRFVSLPATMTLHEVGMVHDRAAARFEYLAAGTVTLENTPVDVKFSGQGWRDLATGFTVKATSRASVTGMFGAQPGVFQLDMTVGVDWGKSRL
jgi:hypothetical protein